MSGLKDLPQPPARKIIQIAFEPEIDSQEVDNSIYRVSGWATLHALCDDGTIWYLVNHEWTLWALPSIPQTPI